MIIQFTIGNFLSFKEQSTLSLAASALKEIQVPAEDIIFSVGTAGLLLMKSAVVYGANASGKSNFIKAFEFFKWYVINSSKDIQAGERVNIESFRLNSLTAGEPSYFEAIFCDEDNQYRYGFEADNSSVHSEWLYQKALLDKMEILPVQYFYESDDKDEEEYRSALSNLYVPAQVYVDALFGVGLSRKVSGVYRVAIEEWNEHKKKCGAYGVAVDICSGLDAKSGQMLGACVKADVQITFGYGKVGQFLYPGASLSDQTIICDIGMPNEAVYHVDGFPFNCLEKSDAKDWLGNRCLWGNKGTFGRVVIIAGSSGMAGAAYLSALAAYRTGAGLVDIVTPKCNRLVLQQLLPEAVLHCISEISKDEEQLEYLRNEVLPKAKAIVIGPGLSTDTLAKKLLDMVLEWNRSQNCPIVIDADALNLLAMRIPWRKCDSYAASR